MIIRKERETTISFRAYLSLKPYKYQVKENDPSEWCLGTFTDSEPSALGDSYVSTMPLSKHFELV